MVDGADEEEGELDQHQHQTTCQKSVRREIYVKIIFSFGEISNFQHMICILKIFLWLLILTFHIKDFDWLSYLW